MIESLSDHQYVYYNPKSSERKTPAVRKGWAWRELNIEKLDSIKTMAKAPSTDNAETSSIESTEILMGACNSCMPCGQYKWGRKTCYLWTPNIADIREEFMHIKRRLRKARQRGECCLQRQEEYRLLKRNLKTEIR